MTSNQTGYHTENAMMQDLQVEQEESVETTNMCIPDNTIHRSSIG